MRRVGALSWVGSGPSLSKRLGLDVEIDKVPDKVPDKVLGNASTEGSDGKKMVGKKIRHQDHGEMQTPWQENYGQENRVQTKELHRRALCPQRGLFEDSNSNEKTPKAAHTAENGRGAEREPTTKNSQPDFFTANDANQREEETERWMTEKLRTSLCLFYFSVFRLNTKRQKRSPYRAYARVTWKNGRGGQGGQFFFASIGVHSR